MARSALLTGSTGYLGINLLHNLLRQKTIDQVLCATRHKDHEAFWKSIQSQANTFNVPLNLSEAKSKVEVVSVDLANNHALILPTLEKYKQTVNAVHHLACDSTYGHPIEHFQPWINCTKALIRYCMDPKYPKHLYAVGSYGQRLIDHPSVNPIEDSYWINGYFQYKRWLSNYMQAKMDEGLSGTLFEPAYIIGAVDPGQDYIFWRIARMFVELGYGFEYPMGFTTIEMMIDNYMLTVNYPDKVQRVMAPCIPYHVYVHKALQKLVPDLKIVDYQEFRNIIKKMMPKRLKYFGPNVPSIIKSTKIETIFHPLYDATKFAKEDPHDYLLTCSSLTKAVELGLQDRDKIRHMKKNVAG
jgi:thioester reductase-like protein